MDGNASILDDAKGMGVDRISNCDGISQRTFHKNGPRGSGAKWNIGRGIILGVNGENQPRRVVISVSVLLKSDRLRLCPARKTRASRAGDRGGQ